MGKRGGIFVAARAAIEQRNDELLRRYKAGESLASIGVAVDLTRERVRQIVQRSGAAMPLEYKCAVKECSTSPRAPRRYCFAHQLRLERYGDPLGSRPLLREQHGTIACYHGGGCRCDRCRRAEGDRRREYEQRANPEMRPRNAR
jgi:hypothetical protein